MLWHVLQLNCNYPCCSAAYEFQPFRSDFGGKIKNFQRESRIISKIREILKLHGKD